MNEVQRNAFRAASGNLDPHVMPFLCIGLLIAVLFLWAAWGMVDVWQGWANEKVREAAMSRFVIRVALLLVMVIWMFAS
ncbi:TIGR03758 family integrating conjugative element protein [Photorhabdus laumondii]|uniref:TIGR03758 family integrating conjugative element protein n=1 Tax=Photorhabdus laumondii subsp. clarkei TaxID=2029685 RepID=A0A329VIH4_9GAMM|nr:TIGR03758 family integrating conjugative element protein [Photorhabdus laumondii]RAW91738.1 TIGR03758 family integrating conjugative element protein [Photorhabdus laumondii subsp. clarkei]